MIVFFFSGRRRHTRCALVTGVQTCALPILQDAGARIGVLWSANFSLGVALLEELVERAAGALAGWNCDIVEMHHTRKLDAPSGTALALGAAAEKAGAAPRYASLRAGDIVGEHLVQFATDGERRSEEHTSELQSLMRISYAVFCWKKK